MGGWGGSRRPAPRLLLETGLTLFCLAPRLPSTGPPPPPWHLLTSDASHPSPSTQEARASSPVALGHRVQKWGQVSPVWPPGRTAGQSSGPVCSPGHSLLTVCIYLCTCLYVYTCVPFAYTCVPNCMYTCVSNCMYTCVCLCVYTCIPDCMYTPVYLLLCIHVCA